jgi:hypothetical protein
MENSETQPGRLVGRPVAAISVLILGWGVVVLDIVGECCFGGKVWSKG